MCAQRRGEKRMEIVGMRWRMKRVTVAVLGRLSWEGLGG